jgi:hypothetical protein
MNRGSADEGASPQEEDKARMLFGSRLMVSTGLHSGASALPNPSKEKLV